MSIVPAVTWQPALFLLRGMDVSSAHAVAVGFRFLATQQQWWEEEVMPLTSHRLGLVCRSEGDSVFAGIDEQAGLTSRCNPAGSPRDEQWLMHGLRASACISKSQAASKHPRTA